ncbi:unnamed protein product, partial [Candidula unifasciata]
MSECMNRTGPGDHNPAEETDSVINQWLIPGTCAFELLHITSPILLRRQLQKSFRTLEQGANFCLVSLALSDLMFCLFALLTMLLPADNIYSHSGLSLTYGVYNVAIINVFIMESTLLTVAMSLERYLAICFPLRLDIYLTTSRIKFVVLFTFIFSVCFNIPVLWRKEDVLLCVDLLEDQVLNSSRLAGFSNLTNHNITFGNATQDITFNMLQAVSIPNSTTLLENNSLSSSLSSLSSADMIYTTSTISSSYVSTHISTDLSSSSKTNLMKTLGKPRYTVRTVLLLDSYVYDIAYRILWAFCGNIIPLVLLFYFNVCLCRQIFYSYKQQKHLGRQNKTRNSSNSLTLTLVAIVALFFILVAPSEITLLVLHISNSGSNSTPKIIEPVLNWMQSINFSVNFILYCIINPFFRKTLKHMILCGCCWLPRNKREWKIKLQTSF